MKFKTLALKATIMGLIATPAFAHHSFAMFDSSKSMEIEGNVKRFQWTNPHSWVYVSGTNAAGQPVEWAVEMGAPAGLVKQGWTPRTLSPGMKVKMTIRPLKDGGNGGQFLSVTLPDGKQMGDSQPEQPAG
jgi:hypothetical protein